MFKRFFNWIGTTIYNVIGSVIYYTGKIICHPFSIRGRKYHEIRFNVKLNALIIKFQEEGKDYETAHALALKCMSQYREGFQAYEKAVGIDHPYFIIVGAICIWGLLMYLI